MPNVPSKICTDCKKSIIAFYVLKKNFQENEVVLVGKEAATREIYEKSAETNSIRMEFDEFLKQHEHDDLEIEKSHNKLTIYIKQNKE